MNPRIELRIGERFGRLIVVKRMPGSFWECKCDCGNSKSVTLNHLKTGMVTSCGCLRLERLRNKITKHGKTKTRVHNVWIKMRSRCADIENANYGGRGIRVCKRWEVFSNFLQDMGEPPNADSTIERKDVNKGYSPANCVWVPKRLQSNNTRRNRVIVFRGQRKNLAEWANFLGIKYFTLHARLRRGWSGSKTLSQPVRRIICN